MAKLETGTDVITARANASIKAHKATIIQEFIAGAKKKGHKIPASAIKSIKLNKIKNLSFSVQSFDIGKFVIDDPDVPVYLDGTSWDNNADTVGNTSFDVDETTTDTYSWSMTAGVKTGLKVSAGVEYGLPGNKGTASVEASIEASLSATQGTASSKSRTWRKHIGQNINPYTHFEQRIYGVQVKGHAPYKIVSKATGTAEISIAFDFHGSRVHKADVALTRLLPMKEQVVSHEGVIEGLQGYDWDIQSESRPLTEQERTSLQKGLNTTTLSITEFKLAG